MWIEIFKTGTHTDSSGKTETWTERDLDDIVSQYNPEIHEAPVVIGHPKDNVPAFGWAETLKREGQVLYAKLKDLVPEFVDLLKRNMFKKRSISLYPDGGLKHIGFLGAVPPAIKGLADIKFSQDESISIESFLNEGSFEIKTFSETEVKRLIEGAKEEGKREARHEAQAEFTQRDHKRQQEAKKKEITTYLENKVKDGILPPALVDLGLAEFMETLDVETEFEFSEGNTTTPLGFMQSFIDHAGKLGIFSEIAIKTRVNQFRGSEHEEALGKSIAEKANQM